MCHLQFRNLLLFLVLPVLPSGHMCVCVCVCFDSARTGAYSARTVHGHSARAETLQIPQKIAPGFKTKKNMKKHVSGYFIWFHAISQITCYLHHLLRVRCGVHCGVHCACTVRALCVHCQNTGTQPAPPSCSSIGCWGTLVSLWCCAVLAAAICLLVSFCACGWNTFLWSLVLATACALASLL